METKHEIAGCCAMGLCGPDAAQIARDKAARRKRINSNRRARNDAMRSLGLVRVRGALGGVYWE